MLQYFRCKARDPAKTSAIFVLPATVGKRQEWTGLLKGMELLKRYTTRDRVYRACKEGGKCSGNPVDIWYDAPLEYPPPPPLPSGPEDLDQPPDPLALTTGAGLPDLVFATTIGARSLLTVVDTGANCNLLTEEEALAANLEITPSQATKCKVAGGKTVRIMGEAKCPFRMGPYSGTVTVYVVKTLIEGVGMILGSPWQKREKVLIDCANIRIKVGRSNRVINSLKQANTKHNEAADSRTFVAQAKSGPVDPRMMTTKQAAKAIKRGAKYLMVNIRQSQPSISQPGTPGNPGILLATSGIPPDETNPGGFGADPVPNLAGRPT